MKIVILSDGFPPESLGGAEIIASNLAHILSGRGCEVSVITTTKDQGKVGVSKDKKLNIYRLYCDYDVRFKAYRSLNNRKIVKEVGKVIKRIKPDIVHAHNIHTHISYASLKEAKKYSKAVFLTVHDVMSVNYGKLGAEVNSFGNVVPDPIDPFKQLFQHKFRYNPFRNIFISYYLKSLDKIFSVSEALKKVLEKEGISNIEVLHNGIDVSKWGVDEKKLLDFKQKYNLKNKKVLFFGGRLSSAKGGLVAVDVLKEVLSRIKEAVLLVVGDKNKSIEEMMKKIEGLGVKEKVVFTGWIDHDDIRYAYASSDLVLVLSQYIDPFPTINLEAMASKKPIIGTVFGGTSEVVLDNKTGYMVNPRDVDLISRKTIELLQNPEKAKAFGLAGYERVRSNFSENDWADKTLSWYAKILRNKK